MLCLPLPTLAYPSGPPPETSSPGFYSGIANLNFKALESGKHAARFSAKLRAGHLFLNG